MFEPFRQFFKSKKTQPGAQAPAGERLYVIGDIHGRLDLFDALIEAVEDDDRQQTPATTTIILLGDLVDRGPDSAGVIGRARAWQQQRPVRILAGNHEEMFLESFDDTDVLRHFLKHGGRETILSYGVDRKSYLDCSLDELQGLMRRHIPAEDTDFLRSFEEYIQLGDYVFVHAGINPGVPLAEQKRRDMLWIRERFLQHTEPHSHIVVHGHTIFTDVDEQHNRIGIDTGAYRNGRLTALVLEGDTRRIIQTIQTGDTIAIEKRNTAT